MKSWLLCLSRLVSKIDNVMHCAHLVKQASVDWMVTQPMSFFGGLYIVHCLMWIGTVRTYGKVYLWSRQTFCPPMGLSELVILRLPYGFICVVVADDHWWPGHKVMIAHVSHRSYHVTTHWAKAPHGYAPLLHTSFWLKCWKLRYHDFSGYALCILVKTSKCLSLEGFTGRVKVHSNFSSVPNDGSDIHRFSNGK